MRRNTNHQEAGLLFPTSICELCSRYRHHPLWPKQDRKRFRYEKYSWQVIKRQLVFIFSFLLFFNAGQDSCEGKVLEKVLYLELGVLLSAPLVATIVIYIDLFSD